MKYLLDTDICIELIRRRSPALLERLTAFSPEEIGVSAITVAELQFGAQRSSQPQRNLEALELFLLPLTIVDFDFDAAARYGGLRSDLEMRGQPIGPYDMLIASQALSLELTLVSNKTREFSRVTGLRIENWLT